MNKENAKRLLEAVHSILKEMKLAHFLIDGTLLGAVRDGDFIAHDNDIDLGVFVEEWTDDVLNEFLSAANACNIWGEHFFGELPGPFELSLISDEVKLDLFFYRKDGVHRIFHAFKNGGKNLSEDIITYEYPAMLIENIRPMIFQGEEYPAPADPVAVLEVKYGPEWRVPVKEWDWQYGPHNVRGV